MEAFILEMSDITKQFPGVRALDGVSLKVKRGEIHCLVGENGAGKSTLMKILSGGIPTGDFSGKIVFNGKVQEFSHIGQSEKTGIAIIYQELALIPDLSVYENIFLGNEIVNGVSIDWNETIKQAKKLLQKVRLDINPATKVRDLRVGEQQLVEIAKALSRDVNLLVLDEPTSALNETDVQNLFEILKSLQAQGVTSVLITHKLKEVVEIADTVTVLRDGKTVRSLDAAQGEVLEEKLIQSMVGREMKDIYPKRTSSNPGKTVLEVRNWTGYDPNLGRKVFRDVNLHLRAGEVVGLAGLMGSGRTEVALSMFGNPAHYKMEGEIFVNGDPKFFSAPGDAIAAGLAYVSEDRKSNGLILMQDVKQNITLANLDALADFWGVINSNDEIRATAEYVESLNIKTPSIEQKLMYLSGGNQQKVSLAKWLFLESKVLILDEPTRGIDVGAKYEIYTIINKLVEQGLSILMISSELPEVLGMSDRIYVMSSGTITGEIPAKEATEEKVMTLATKN